VGKIRGNVKKSGYREGRSREAEMGSRGKFRTVAPGTQRSCGDPRGLRMREGEKKKKLSGLLWNRAGGGTMANRGEKAWLISMRYLRETEVKEQDSYGRKRVSPKPGSHIKRGEGQKAVTGVGPY